MGEPGIPNVTMALYRDTDGSGTLTAGDTLVGTRTTDADGGYLFNNLPPATYFVDVTDANNVLVGLTHVVANQSQPDPTGAIVLGASEVYKDADFGYYQTPTSGYAIIGDTVWYDDNSDGIQQPGEPGIPNIQVCATPTGGGASICDTTDSNGHYLIEVPAGSYSVAPINPPASYLATTPVPHLLTVQIGEQYLDADFGYDDKNGPLLGTIGDLVFLDANKDGVCNSGDSALSGVSVDLIRDSNANNAWDAGEPIIATVTTVGGTACSAGNYLFSGVPGGRYLVHVSDTNAVLFDYTKSPLGAAGVDNNNQADPYAINLAPGGSNTTADFGYYPLDRTNIGVIGNQVWAEEDYDGLFDANGSDVGQAGVTVQLLKNSAVIATTTTGASGDYAFVSLPGGTYQVRVSDSFGVLAGYVVTLLGPNPGQDNNNQAQAYQVVLPQGGYNLTADFGYIKLGAIGDFVWYDKDHDGIEDVGEPGIPNVTVALYRDDDSNGTLSGGDTLVGTLTTDADGGYLFNNLPPATYFVDVTDANNVLAGLTHVIANQSQPDPTAAIVLGAGDVYKDADFGYYQTPTTGKAIIGDTVWYDDNGDGVQQPGEPGIPNVQVCATPMAGGAAICDTTDSNGHYLIEVPAGSYSVAPINPPAGYSPTTPVPHSPVIVLAGDQYLKADFGYDDTGNNLLGTIGNLVFLDANKDGVYNGSDMPFAGVSVDLIRDSNANTVWDAGEPIIATVTTASSLDADTGNYLFSGLPDGNYLVHVSDTNGVLYGYTKSPLGAAGVNNNNQADPYAVILPVGGDNLTADFGYHLTDRPMGAIGNQVWIEKDNNGLFSVISGDYGQHGVTVQLRQNSVVIATTTTGASGDYVFVGLQAGSYEVRVSDAFGVLTGYAPTVVGPNPGQDNNNQAQPYAVNLAQGQFNPTADFGYAPGPTVLKDSTIGNLVWVDRNADGLYQGGEPAIGNVTVELWYDVNGNCTLDQFDFLVDTKLTSSSIALGGNYRFSGEFPAGNYVVIVTDANQVLTTYTKSSGPNAGQDNNSQVNPYCIQNFNPTGVGDTNLTADFGYWQPVTVGDFTWVDTNGNNVYDPGQEQPLSGVVVQVRNSSNVVVATVTTGPAGGFPPGTYLVSGLPPGQYTATVLPQPNGYLPSGPTTLTSVNLLSGQSDLTLDFPFVSPTSVLVTNFTATQRSGGPVTLAWTTLAEGGNTGFHVWRATSADGVYQQMTSAPVASQAVGGSGASYEWIDESAVAGKAYFYRLEALPSGQMIGPVSARLWGMQLFVPVVRTSGW
ncbi:SdrD B-like domain-containing protein [Candidatus Amarolinea dominans]|uniref:SdrD B-like domain-containing protein n=1 Tax=Candidatus Amarolinea dominans TaxID=3140696 RepID=UPI0031CC70C0